MSLTGETASSSGSGVTQTTGSTVTTMATHVNRAPPTMKLESQPYMMWKKDVQIWQALTTLPKSKQGLDVYMSLDSKYKAFVGLSVEQLSADEGVKSNFGQTR